MQGSSFKQIKLSRSLENDEVMDGNFVEFQTVCTGRSGVDELTVTEFTNINSTTHDFEPGDLVWFKIVRPDDFQSGDFEGDAYLFGGELRWQN